MYILCILIFFLSTVGAVELIAWIKYLLLKPESVNKTYLVLPIEGRIENMEQLLRYYRHRLEWDMPSAGIDKLVILDNGADESTKEICLRFCDENNEFCVYDSNAKGLSSKK